MREETVKTFLEVKYYFQKYRVCKHLLGLKKSILSTHNFEFPFRWPQNLSFPPHHIPHCVSGKRRFL